ncbi:hypothetical protein GCM10027592_39930 [Spirosoma flavus]
MNLKNLVFALFSSWILAAPVWSQQVLTIRNDTYQISVPARLNSKSVLTITKGNLRRSIRPELLLQSTTQNPNLQNTAAEKTRYPIGGWKRSATDIERDAFKVAPGTYHQAVSVRQGQANELIFSFKETSQGSLSLRVTLPAGQGASVIEMQLTPKTDAYYSLGFTGLTPTDTSNVQFLYQPMTWSWRRFPNKSYLAPEAFALTAATFVNTNGLTEGVAPDPSEIPYRYAFTKNSRFGLVLRDEAGKARPMLFAPILGSDDSKMTPGKTYSFKLRYVLHPGDWYTGTQFILRDIFHYKKERQNATVSLNQTLQNMIDYAMGPYGGWVEELKGSDYVQDVVGSVKNVSALHALGVALSTGSMEIYRRRALPMMEYVMSREKYLYAISDTIRLQSPSHFLKGPCVEIGELSGLHDMTGGRTSAFQLETERIFGKARKLNLNTATGGDSWQDFLARYRMLRTPADLEKTRQKADAAVKQELGKYPTNFQTNAGLKDTEALFYTDFTPRWLDLLELYEETKEPRYLEAAITGARQMLLWLRSNPMAPDSLITVNQGGVVKGQAHKRYKINSLDFLPGFDATIQAPEQKIDAWRTSLVGLSPEQPHTYVGNGPIMLAHHAAYLLRLAHLANDTLFRDAAYNAVVGRYANFPGYYFTTLATNVYQSPDYPLHDYWDIKFNFIFFNHIWPHIALVMDFLVSDAYRMSKGKVNFPSAYAPGYAYLSSKVYGHKSGEVFGNKDVRLWLPANAMQVNDIALNHLFGVGQNDLYVVLMNTANKAITSTLSLQPDLIPWNKGQTYKLTIYQADGTSIEGTMTDGKLSANVPALGLIGIKIHGLKVDVPLQKQAVLETGNGTSTGATTLPKEAFHRKETATQLGTVTGMLFNLVPQFSDAYIFTDATEKTLKQVTLRYRLGNQEWKTVEDTRYPYEFSIHLNDPKQVLEYKLEGIGTDGKSITIDPMTLRN